MVEAVLQAVIEGKVESFGIHLSRVPATIDRTLLSAAVVKVRNCQIGGFNAVQLEEILTALANTEDAKLRRLEIIGFTTTDLTHIPPEILSQAMGKLENLDEILLRVRPSPQQVAHLFTKIRDTEELKFSEMWLDDTNDISQVPPAVFGEVITRLEDVTVYGSAQLSPDQLSAIFTELAGQQHGDFKLKGLWFRMVDMTAVTPENLVAGIQKLEKISFVMDVLMMADQINAILSMVSEGHHGRLNYICIQFPDVIGTISPVLLQSAKEVGGPLLHTTLRS